MPPMQTSSQKKQSQFKEEKEIQHPLKTILFSLDYDLKNSSSKKMFTKKRKRHKEGWLLYSFSLVEKALGGKARFQLNC
jgi:hypothetical protein